MLDLIQIGKRIADLRKQQGLTQGELAEQLYVTHQAVSKWEQGKSVPSIDILYQLTQLFQISIDLLLDDTDIEDNDYDRLFQAHPRHVVIQRFLRSSNPSDTLDQLFSRLTQKERLTIINHIIHQAGNLEVHDIWPYLNNSERTYLLGAIFSGLLDYNLQAIVTKLTTEEQYLAQEKHNSGDYPYPLSVRYHFKH